MWCPTATYSLCPVALLTGCLFITAAALQLKLIGWPAFIFPTYIWPHMDTAPGNVATENMSTNSAYALTHMKVRVLADVSKSAGGAKSAGLAKVLGTVHFAFCRPQSYVNL